MTIRSRATTWLTLLALAAPVFVAQALLAPPAGAHAALVAATPGLNAKVEALPAAVKLEFSDEMNQPSQISVIGPDGQKIGRGETTVDANTVVRSIADPGQSGIYRVDYRVVSADGHPVTGSYKFTVTTGVPTESKATSEPLASEKEYGWFFILFGGVVVVIVGLSVTARLRRGSDE